MSQKKITQDARRAELATKARSGEKGLAEVRALANGDDQDAFLARSVLAEMGGKEGQANFPSGSSESSGMKDGGMARGKGGKMYQHNYATGGSVVDHLGGKK